MSRHRNVEREDSEVGGRPVRPGAGPEAGRRVSGLPL